MFKIALPVGQYAILFCLIFCCTLGADQTITVEPGGSIATLDQARLRVRELKQEHPDQPIEVLIKAGVYSLRETVVFGLEDSGSEGAKVVYKAFPGEEPEFTGGVSIKHWEKVSV